MGLVLSTSWNAFRYNRAAGLIREIKALGFKDIELSFSLTSSMVAGVGNFVQRGEIGVASLHNYCPIPRGLMRSKALPDCYSMSSLREEERQQALKYSKNTIDTAKELGAKAVVLHCGRVEIPDRTRDLINLCRRGHRNCGRYRFLKELAVGERKKYAALFVRAALKSLSELESYARKSGVKLGIETRFYYREIPSFEETGLILKALRDSSIFYWHDTGHAQLMQELGFGRQRDYLDAYAGSMVGVHLHDIRNCRDHLAPGTGEVDFNSLKPYLKKNTLKVIEAHSSATPEDLKESSVLLEKIFDARA